MNHVADSIPSDLLAIPPLSSQTPLPQPLYKPIKILVIHGHGSSSSRAFYKYRGLQPLIRHHIMHTLHRDVEFYFPNAPLLPAGFEPGMWTWGLGDYRVDRVPGLQESVSFLVRYMEEHGPFDGVMGSSAGATVAIVVASLLEGDLLRGGCEEVKMKTNHPPLKFMISYSGFKMGHARYRSIYRPKIQTPIMHFIGELDTYIPGTLTLKLAERCVNNQVVYFPGGHYIPRLKRTTVAAAGFICDCLDIGGCDDESEWEEVDDDDL
ncbi:hypothetical protein P170DRAFT_505447 [Aspergillus steynii IBT 23096]|uniref:Serine hydrolase domain-containing protein n=1 Tax=Aspergillus steynii IBT 23096 TaxID=1392250 RepID=A0A2I2GPF1_9EURO|nr:uncharacterized protein P170DRAFT_505447 [Aspergillus steynii IBT 23096]PLB54749.1 hypothetical protein P170DRAFT_505447 [Aspergillus steynii IBT 23096]